MDEVYKSQSNQKPLMSEQKTLFRDQPLLDAFEQQLANNWLPLEIDQISFGNYQGQLREVRQNDVSVFFEHQNRTIHKRGVMEDQFCTISFVRSVNSRVRFSEYSAFDSSLFFLPSGTEFDVLLEGDAETVYFRFNQSHLLERARAMNPTIWENNPDNLLVFDALDRKPLDALANHLYANPIFQSNSEVTHSGDMLGALIMDQVVMTLGSSSLSEEEHPDLTARRRAVYMVRQVVEYIDAAIDSQFCPSIVDVCADINVSQRNFNTLVSR